MIIEINAIDDGKLTITLPRELIDRKENNKDEKFVVLIYGENRTLDDIEKTDSTRKLEISFPKDSKKIEILGSHVVPEFGMMATVIFGIAITSIIALGFRSRIFTRF